MSEIPEAVILDMQTRAYQRSKELDALRQEHARLKLLADEARGHVALAVQQLREVLTFLSEHNSDAHDDWFAEFDMTPCPSLGEVPP